MKIALKQRYTLKLQKFCFRRDGKRWTCTYILPALMMYLPQKQCIQRLFLENKGLGSSISRLLQIMALSKLTIYLAGTKEYWFQELKLQSKILIKSDILHLLTFLSFIQKNLKNLRRLQTKNITLKALSITSELTISRTYIIIPTGLLLETILIYGLCHT